MIVSSLQGMLERDEGREYDAYPDPLTKGDPWTIGIGHTGPNVYRGLRWTDQQIDDAFDADMEVATECCDEHFQPWFDGLNEQRQAVLIAMTFQMGVYRLLAFTNTLAAVAAGRFDDAANGMLNSIWAHQTPTRAARMALQMRTGDWV